MYNKKIEIHWFTLVLLFISFNNFAANWLMLQGTEKPKAKQHKFWGFIQPAYTYDTSDELSGLTGSFAANNGRRTAKNSVAPWFDDDSKVHVRRARFGVRGRFTHKPTGSFASKINYFTLFETATNLLTYDPFGDRARTVALDHISMTFNHIKGARVRVGLFKTPGPEESFNAIHTLNYIEFTDFIAREQLERFVSGASRPAGSPLSPALGTPTNTAYGFNGVRDWGVQVFDSFKTGNWDLSYAAMLGRGEGIHETSDSDGNEDLYLYLSAEYNLPGGRGPYKHGIKYYAWSQNGKREFATDPGGTAYDRSRYGFGIAALGKFFGSSHKQRFGVELMFADGMLFLSPAGGVAQGSLNSGNLQYAAEEGNKSRGLTLDYGFYFNKKWDVGIRYARHDLLYEQAQNVNPGNERIFKEWTFAITHRFTPKKRLSLNYTLRDIEAPTAYTASGGFAGAAPAVVTSNVNSIVNTTDDRIALQFTWIF